MKFSVPENPFSLAEAVRKQLASNIMPLRDQRRTANGVADEGSLLITACVSEAHGISQHEAYGWPMT